MEEVSVEDVSMEGVAGEALADVEVSLAEKQVKAQVDSINK